MQHNNVQELQPFKELQNLKKKLKLIWSYEITKRQTCNLTFNTSLPTAPHIILTVRETRCSLSLQFAIKTVAGNQIQREW